MVLVQRDFSVELHRPAVQVAHEGTAAFIRPFHRPAQGLGGVQQRQIFGVDVDFHTERAADIVGQDAQFFGIHLQDMLGQVVAQAEHALGTGVEDIPVFFRIVVRDAAARLDRGDDQAIVVQAHFGDVGRLGEGFLGLFLLAAFPMDGGVVRRQVRPDLLRPRCGGLFQIDDRLQHFHIQVDQFGRVLGLNIRIGDHHGDRFAGIANPVGGKRHPGRLDHVAAVGVLQRHDAGRGSVPGFDQILAGNDHVDAGAVQSGGDIDIVDDGVGVGRTEDIGIELPIEIQVVRIFSVPCQQGGIFFSGHVLPNSEFPG